MNLLNWSILQMGNLDSRVFSGRRRRVILGLLVMRVLVLGLVVVLPVLLAVAAVLVAPTNAGPEAMIFALLVSRNVVMRISAIPTELVLFMGRHVDVLEVTVGLTVTAAAVLRRHLLRPRVSGAEADAQSDQKGGGELHDVEISTTFLESIFEPLLYSGVSALCRKKKTLFTLDPV